jgi:hypothetical protein
MDDQSSSLPSMSDALICEDADRSEIIALAEEVYLDDMAPVELRRLWDVRKKRLASKGHSMWENITRDYLGHEEADALGVGKRALVKASLQMKFHRGVLRHAVWPAPSPTTENWNENWSQSFCNYFWHVHI